MAEPARACPQIQFGMFTVDVRAGELRKRGSRIKLQERPFQLLVTLLERPGELVTREELRQRLWPDGTFVDFDHSISSAVNKLRGALNDSATQPRYIETVGRRGYRFLYPLTPAAPAAPARVLPFPKPASSQPRWVLAAIGFVVLATLGIVALLRRPERDPGRHAIRSLAVLPLKNLSSDPQEEYFSDGLTDELITRLASLDGLRVISRTSAMHYRDSTKPLPEIARELNVDAIVEGSVLRSEGRVRITAQLLEGATDRHIWAESYERDQRDIIALQDEVAQQIAEHVELRLNSTVSAHLAGSRSVDPAAHDDYLRGRFEWSKRTAAGLRSAIVYFQRAIQRDPAYARAYAGLADCYTLMTGYTGLPADQTLPQARAAALKAIELDDHLAEAHTSLALIHENYDWDWTGAEKEFRRALELDPNYATAHQWYAEYLGNEGRFDEARAESARAIRLDPMSLIIAADNAALFYFDRQYDEAIRRFRAVLAVDPDFPRANMIIFAYLEKGMFEEALNEVNRRYSPQDSVRLMWLAMIHGRSGHRAEAEAALRRLEQFTKHHPMDAADMLHACIHTGHRDKAFAWFEKAYQQHSTAMTTMKVAPFFDPIRGDPRFQELTRRVHLDQ